MPFIARSGSATIQVPINQSVIVSSIGGGTTTAVKFTSVAGIPSDTIPLSSISNGIATYGPFTTPTTLRITASSLCEVEYVVGSSPTLTSRPLLDIHNFGRAVGDGVTDDTEAVAAAVAFAFANGLSLNWSAGTYLTTASIPNLHSVRHYGPGAIKRGSDIFYPSPNRSQTNRIYVSAAGSASNDGLSASQPISTVQGGFNALLNYGPFLEGTWVLQLAAGTYAAASQLVGLRSRNRIQIKGPSVGGHPNVPTAVIDGTGISVSVGMYLQVGIYATIQDVKYQNWTFGTDAYGFSADGQCDVILTNVHAYNCYYAGISIDNLSQIRMQGGIIDSCTTYGVRLYSQVSASIGYSGSSVGDSTIIKNCTGAGIYGAVSSRVHVDYPNINNNAVGLFIEKNTRAVANYTLFDTNTVAVRYDQNSVYGESGATNTFTSNGKNYISYGSEDDVSAFQRFWDRTTQRTLFGATAYRSVNAKWEWQMDSAASGASYNSAAKAIFDGNSATNYLGLSGPTTSQTGLIWSTVSKSAQAVIAYNFSSDDFRVWVNGADAYRLKASSLIPVVDNTKTLGESSFRWSVVYAGTGAINTSDAREKEQVTAIPDAVLDAWLDVDYVQFKFIDAVQTKGDNARWHTGVIAQRVKDAFIAHGLDAAKYGVLCYDEWPARDELRDDDGNIVEEARPAGNRYGVRYEEALCLEAALMRRELRRIQGRSA